MKPRVKFHDWKIEDGKTISGRTEDGANITRDIVKVDGSIVETPDFELELQDLGAPKIAEEEKERVYEPNPS